MAARVSSFPVGNGEMTVVRTEGDHRNLIEMNIRSDDGPDNGAPPADPCPHRTKGKYDSVTQRRCE